MELPFTRVIIVQLAWLAVVLTKRDLALLARLIGRLYRRAGVALDLLHSLWIKLVRHPGLCATVRLASLAARRLPRG